jgi:hypothetical protein
MQFDLVSAMCNCRFSVVFLSLHLFLLACLRISGPRAVLCFCACSEVRACFVALDGVEEHGFVAGCPSFFVLLV